MRIIQGFLRQSDEFDVFLYQIGLLVYVAKT